MAFFSVIIPTFNRANKLKRAIQSVLDQTFTDFELLVMDDGSTDDTESVVHAFVDSRIRYEWDQNSGGPATPRNRGIEAARAGWICFLDADDIWYSKKLEIVYRCIQSYPAIDVFCNNEFLRDRSNGKTRLLKYGPYEADFYRKMLVQGNRVSTSTVTARKDFLNCHCLRFNETKDYIALEDYDLWLRIALHGGKFYFIDKVLGEYIIEDHNLSSNTESVRHNREVLLRDHVFGIQSFEPNKKKLWRQIQSRIALGQAKTDLIEGKLKLAIGRTLKALIDSPINTIHHCVSKIVHECRRIFTDAFHPSGLS